MRFFAGLTLLFAAFGFFSFAYAAQNSLGDFADARTAFEHFGPSRNKNSLNDPVGMMKFGNQLKKLLPVVRVSVHNKADYRLLSFCSGTLVSESQVITAKKCLEAGNEEIMIFVTTDFYKKGDIAATPDALTWSDASSIATNEWGVAVLNLRKPIGAEAGFFKIHSSAEALPDLGISLAGFPQNANEVQRYRVPVKHIIHDCEIARSLDASSIYSNCYTAPGLIGGPLFYTKDGQQYLVGVMLEQLSLEDSAAEVSVSRSFFADDLRKLLGE